MNNKKFTLLTIALFLVPIYAEIPANKFALYTTGYSQTENPSIEAAIEALSISSKAMQSTSKKDLKTLSDILLNVSKVLKNLQDILSADLSKTATVYNSYIGKFIEAFTVQFENGIEALEGFPNAKTKLTNVLNDLKSLDNKNLEILADSTDKNKQMIYLVTDAKTNIISSFMEVQKEIKEGRWPETIHIQHVIFKAMSEALDSIKPAAAHESKIKKLKILFDTAENIFSVTADNYATQEGIKSLHKLDLTHMPQVAPKIVSGLKASALKNSKSQIELDALAKEFSEKVTLLPSEVVVELEKQGLRDPRLTLQKKCDCDKSCNCHKSDGHKHN